MPSKEVLFPWTGPTRKARGRNHFNADAIGFERNAEEQTLYVHNRVASNGKTHIGWCAMPDDPALIREFANGLLGLADDIEKNG